MRSILLLFVAVCSVAIMKATDGGTTFRVITSWDEALEMAKAQGKPIFLDAYTDWCGWCKVMDKETFSNTDVAKVMNEAFVCVKMDMETGEGIDVAMKYRISSYPYFMVFSKEGRPTYRSSGYEAWEPWLATLAKMQNPSLHINAPGITPGVNMAWPVWHRESYAKGKARKFPDTSVVRSWLAQHPDKYDEMAWSVILRYDVGAKWESFALTNESEYARRYGPEVGALHDQLSQRYFMAAVMGKDPTLLDKAVAVSYATSVDQKQLLRLRYDAMYGQRVQNWTMVGGSVRAMATRPDAIENSNTINEFSWSIYEKCSDKDALADATWAMEKITKDAATEWALVDTYAALLYKSGRMDEARTTAQRAIDLGTAKDADVTETRALLEKIKAGK